MKTGLCTLVATFCLSAGAPAQGFINLDFEQAIIERLPPDSIFLEWSLAVPGWGGGMAFVYYQQTHLGVSERYLLMDSTSPVWAPGTQLAGNYSLAFASGHSANDPFSPWNNAGITQSGFIPSSARSIRMLGTGPFKVFLGGVEIPMLSLGGNSYGGDVSGFAGTTAGLQIINTASADDYTWSIVDNILFSPAAIPEPDSAVLLLAGWLLLWSYGCHTRKR